MESNLIRPSLGVSFDYVFLSISRQSGMQTPKLETTGHVFFVAEAKHTHDGRRFISLPHSNRIYETDWWFRSNCMGKDGQRIGQYAIPIDEWAKRL